jgi:hypothetical protein
MNKKHARGYAISPLTHLSVPRWHSEDGEEKQKKEEKKRKRDIRV